YAPLAYYVGGTFILLGFDALLATKAMMILGVLLSGVFMYLLAKEFWGEIGGAVSALFYMYAPYHAVDIYVRGDVAEFWAYAFIPLSFYGLIKIYKNPKWGYVAVGALGFAGVILSHNLTAMMVTPFLLIVVLLNCYISFKKNKLFIIHNSLFIILLGLALSAFYWIPAIVEFGYTNVMSQVGGGADFRDHFVCFSQLWNSPWGFGGSVPGCIDGLSFKIGKLHIISVFLPIIIFIYLKLKHKYFNDIYYLSIFGIVGLLFSVFLTLDVSRFVWQAIPAMAFIQYPWRFLLLISFFTSFLAGAVVSLSSQFKIKPYLTAFLLVFFLLFFNIKLFNPQTIFSIRAAEYTNDFAIKWTASKISDEYLPANFKKPKSEKEIAKNPIPFKETTLEKLSNIGSLIGILALFIGIISFTHRRLRYD
ncbi:MAG: hypothetical protein AAB662_01615, partial [Patescibacteria group bacterium]